MSRSLANLPKKQYDPQVDGFSPCVFDAYIDPKNVILSECEKMGVSKSFHGLLKVKATATELFSFTEGEVFMKAFPQSAEIIQDGGLSLEVIMLRYLNLLTAYRVTPCIPKYYMDFSCSGYSGQVGAQIQKSASCIYQKPEDPMVYCMTEAIRGELLHEWLEDFSSKTEMDFRHVLFQLLYTCHEFHLAKVRHNDLHSQNVIIKKIPPIDMAFIVGGKMIKLEKCRYIAKIIDYDKASFYEIKNCDFSGEMCETFGVCSYGPNPKKDPVLLLTRVAESLDRYSSVSNVFLRFCMNISSDVPNMIIKGLSKYKSKFFGHLCYDPDYVAGYSDVECNNWIPDDKLFKPFLETLQYFGLPIEELTRLNPDKIPDAIFVSLSEPESIYKEFIGEKTARNFP